MICLWYNKDLSIATIFWNISKLKNYEEGIAKKLILWSFKLKFIRELNIISYSYHYRPQTKFGARLYFYTCLSFFSQLWGGVEVVSQHALQVVSQHALQQGVPGPGGSAPGGLLLGGSAPGGGGCSQTGSSPRGVPVGDPPDGYCCGWYASYWNVFLFGLKFVLLMIMSTAHKT